MMDVKWKWLFLYRESEGILQFFFNTNLTGTNQEPQTTVMKKKLIEI